MHRFYFLVRRKRTEGKNVEVIYERTIKSISGAAGGSNCDQSFAGNGSGNVSLCTGAAAAYIQPGQNE